ncbi:MAG: DNA polymerase III subunit gamma/tau [Armatimonadetes bacterium]|nr:DNA polymerase III subunit gamma/tau [Armatimonadota bacterium]
MSYVSLTLKYRPTTFADVVGQEHVTRTLRNAVAEGRIHHAYLFSGPRGTGKTSVARVLGKALNCEHGPTPDPCGQCAMCRAIRDGRALDIVEIDAASNRGIDEIRELRERVKYSPAEARHKLYILDEVHMLTTEAFNALLKTLEEPPAHAFFVLATTEAHRVPATIVSRCQRFDFRRLGVTEIAGALRQIAEAEGIGAEPEALAAIARAADGGMRDAQSILDQMRAYAGDTIDLQTVNSVLGATDVRTLTEIIGAVLSGDARAICETVDRLISAGKDLGRLLDDLMLYARDMSRLGLGVEPIGPVAGAEDLAEIRTQAKALGPQRAMALMTHFAQVRQAFRQSTQHGLLVETALLEAARTRETATQPVAADSLPAQPTVPPARPTPPPEPTPAPPVREAPAPKPAPPPEEPTPVPAVGEGPLRVEIVRQHWPNVEGALRRMRRYPVWALAQQAAPTAVDGNLITLSFGAQWKTLHEKMSGDNRKALEQALSQVLGMTVEVDPILLEGELPGNAAPPRSAEAAPPEAASERFNPVEQVKETFPGSTVMGNGRGGPTG